MSEIPKEWLPKPAYEPSVAWFTREAKKRLFMGEEILSDESEDYPGWYFYFRADQRKIEDHLPDAIGSVKTLLKNWQMKDFSGNTIPIQPSKEERKQMVIKLLEYPIPDPTPAYDPDAGQAQPELLKLKWEFGEYLLVITLWYSPMEEEFTTTMGNPNNPIRSLIGSVGVSQAELEREEEEEEFEADWKTISVGPVAFEGNRLTVGFWSHAFDPEVRVVGMAYEEASFEDQTMSYFLRKGAPQ